MSDETECVNPSEFFYKIKNARELLKEGSKTFYNTTAYQQYIPEEGYGDLNEEGKIELKKFRQTSVTKVLNNWLFVPQNSGYWSPDLNNIHYDKNNNITFLNSHFDFNVVEMDNQKTSVSTSFVRFFDKTNELVYTITGSVYKIINERKFKD